MLLSQFVEVGGRHEALDVSMFANEEHLSITILGIAFGKRVSEQQHDNRDGSDSV